MIEIKLQIDEIDYNSTFDAMYPMLKEVILKDRPELGKSALFNSALLQKTIKGVFSVVPRGTKDGWLCSAVNSHSAEAISYLEGLAREQGADIKISELSAEIKK